MKRSLGLWLTGLLINSGLVVSLAQEVEHAATLTGPSLTLEDRLAPHHPDIRAITSPDWAEPAPAPKADKAPAAAPEAFAVIAPAARQPAGALSGKIVFMNGGHGWTYDSTINPPWRLLRPTVLEMNEDHGNIDQLNFFAMYCFNAGAVVVPFRPLGQQTNEVVIDNVDAGVTFSGPWTNTLSQVFYGKPNTVSFRYAALDTTETATATYTPTIPLTDYYPVYTWVRHGSDRADQLYRIRHTGGESQVRIPHYMVGNGWVYLGEYYFNAGSNAAVGSVVISNLRGTTNGTVVIADAIRFGNGMGSSDNGGGGSGYPREEESARYWIKNSLGVGQSTAIYDGAGDDESDSWIAPPQMSAEMNRETSGTIYDRIHISFHSNAAGGSARGTLALTTTDPTPHQSALALTAGTEVTDDLVALGSPPLELPWFDRGTHTYGGGYSEITGTLINYEMDATIIEVAFHDQPDDARLLRDSKARAAVGKAALFAAIKHLHGYNTNNPPPLAFLPEPPSNVSALAGGNGAITLSWAAPVNLGGSQSPTNYTIYRSTNGYGFGNPVFVGNVTAYTITDLAPNVDYYFRVAASNAGGESMPSEVVGCRASSIPGAAKALVVNAFDRFDRTTNLRQNTTAQGYGPPNATGTIERVWPRRVNSFDYVVPHGKSIAAYAMAFDSCQRQAVTNGTVGLTNYSVVIWESGQSLTNTFGGAEQSLITAFLAGGGNLFVSGAKIAYDLDRSAGPSAADRDFLRNQFHADLTSDVNTNAGSYTVSAVTGSIFAGNPDGAFDDGSQGIYWVQTADVLAPYGSGATAALNYNGNANGAAAIQYDGSAGGGKVVYLGFPFETITSSVRRTAYMGNILAFFGVQTQPEILLQPQSLLMNQGADATFAVTAAASPPLAYQWSFKGAAIPGATGSAYTRANAQAPDAGEYLVVVTNPVGSLTSSVAVLSLNFLPVITNPPTSLVVTQGMDATFSVSSDGTQPLGCQWRFNGANLSGATFTSFTRSNAQPSDAGSYSVVISNMVGAATSGDAVLTVLVPPSISVHPTNVVTGLGLGASFSVTANGTAPLSYQWRRNGADQIGATTNPLVIAGAQAGDAGSYVVVVSNLCGMVTSAAASLTVTDPFVVSQPANQTVAAGATANFSIGAVGTAPLSYQWKKNGADLSDGLNISGATASTLAVTGVQRSDMGQYSVIVRSPNGWVASSNVTLIAPFAPVVAVQPASQKVLAGSTASFTVTPVGPGTLTFQWQRQGTNISDVGKISGAASSNLMIANVQAGEVANYSVTVSNLYGPGVSASALLSEWPLAAWGYNLYGQTDIRPGLDSVVAVACGNSHALALNTNGTVAGWGAGTNYTGILPYFGQANAPAILNTAVAVAAGGYHSLALKADGTVVAWGAGTNLGSSPWYGQAIVPPGLANLTAIAAGLYHSLALRSDGTVVGWGAGSNNAASPHFGQVAIPANVTNVVAVACGNYHNLALKADGTVVAWGAGTSNTGTSPQYGQSMVPATLSNVVAVACGGFHSLAVKADGTVVAWGFNTSGQTSVPSNLSNVAAVAAGIGYSLALKADGTLVGWGSSTYGQTNIPPGVVNAVAIAGGGLFDMVLQNDGRPYFLLQPVSQATSTGTNLSFAARAIGASPMTYQWRHAGTNIPWATGATLTLTNIQEQDAGPYTLVVTNNIGGIASTNAMLTVWGPLRFTSVSLQPDSRLRLQLSGPPGVYALENAPDLANWHFTTNLTNQAGTAEFIDEPATNHTQRFYRARSGL